jgi:hypothetical protein
VNIGEMRITKLLLLLLAFALAEVAPIRAQGCPVEYGFQGAYNFPRKTQSSVTVRKLNEISQAVKGNIEDQLKVRVGVEFFTKLRFDHGYARDFDAATALKADESERIDGYDFVFKFADEKNGLKAYRFKVIADRIGKIIDDLALPDIASHPNKANLISCRDALLIAAKNNFPTERILIYFDYDSKNASFTWSVYDRRAVLPDNSLFAIGKGTFRKMLIEAQTGKVLRIFKETILL